MSTSTPKPTRETHDNEKQHVAVTPNNSPSTSKEGKEKSPKSDEFKKDVDWLTKFQLPTRFSAAVEQGLETKSLSRNLQNEMVRDICLNILRFESHPNKKHREHIAKMVIEKYPILEDVNDFGATKWGTLELKIFNRMKKLQSSRRSNQQPTRNNEPSPKRPRIAGESWATKPDIPEDETITTLTSYREMNKGQVKKRVKDLKFQSEYMIKTYPLRRSEVLDNPCPVKDVIDLYPPLGNFVHIKAEMCRILENESLPTDFHEKFSLWHKRVLQHAKKQNGSACKTLIAEMELQLGAATVDKSNIQELKNRAAFKAINLLLSLRSKKEDEIFTVLERDESIDDKISSFVQPQVVAVGELFDIDSLYIVCEGDILCSIPQQKIVDAIFALLATFYVFNIDYSHGKSIFSFLERALLGIARGKPRVAVTTFLNEVSKEG